MKILVRVSGLLLLCVVLLLISGCTSSQVAESAISIVPTTVVYVLASGSAPGSLTGWATELLVVDADQRRIISRQQLLPWTALGFGRDPQGRLWVGYGQQVGHVDNRVQVFSENGQLMATLPVCDDPYTGFHFAHGRAFVGCAENGFYASLAVIDLETLAVIQRLEIRTTDHFLLATMAGDEQSVVMWGGGAEHGWLKVFDVETFAERATLPTFLVDARSILSYQGRFYVLNIRSYQFPEAGNDLLVLDTTIEPPQLITQTLPARSPLWGAIDVDQLYMYHNPSYDPFISEHRRYISRLNLTTGETQVWPLPDHWTVNSMAALDSRLFVAGQGGLYEFDPATGQLRQLIQLPGSRHRLMAVVNPAHTPQQVPSPLAPVSPLSTE
ncbi:MAG TPA: hypothetical protein VNK95_24770 [Caldilineaceae bacterium]|nr:hypothetical protein [Caldilineaceae bacterium]